MGDPCRAPTFYGGDHFNFIMAQGEPEKLGGGAENLTRDFGRIYHIQIFKLDYSCDLF